MSEPAQPGDPADPATSPAREPDVRPSLRASDAEREQVVQQLSEHATTGRLTLAELEERIDLAYRATTLSELEELTADLPDARAQAFAEPDRRRRATRWIVALMGGTDKRGRWRVAERVNTVAVMGGHEIDMRNAELDSDDTTIVIVTVMGGVSIYVPDTIDVEIGGFSLMGGTGEKGSHRSPRPGAPRVRVLAYNLMGGTDVWRLPDEARDLPLKQAKQIAKKAH